MELWKATTARTQARMAQARARFEADHSDLTALSSEALVAKLTAYELAAGVYATDPEADRIDQELDAVQVRAAQLTATTLRGLRTKVLIAAHWYVESEDTPELTSLLRDLRRWCAVDA